MFESWFSDCITGIERSVNSCFEAMERDIENSLDSIRYDSDNCFQSLEAEYKGCISDIEKNYTRINSDIAAAWKPVYEKIKQKIQDKIDEKRGLKEASKIKEAEQKIKELEKALKEADNKKNLKVVNLQDRKKKLITRVKDKFGGKSKVIADMRKQKKLREIKPFKVPSSW